MNIAMFTNAYDPVIGGLERSIETFTEDLREAGHQVLIVTLAFPDALESSKDIYRLPAIKEVAGTQFSAKLPLPTGLSERLDDFRPDIIHSHHPFMLGDTALRVARSRGLPLVFTHHTLYERYTYQFLRDSQVFERMALEVATEYANLCNLVVAPTHSIKKLIQNRGVETSIQIIPTGIDVDTFASGDRETFRQENDLPANAFVLGYLGRVVQAKNMKFLIPAVIQFLQENKDAWFLLVGDGDAKPWAMEQLQNAGVSDRVVATGSLSGKSVADAYAAMDLFTFASETETQGIVLIEGLCAGVPVVGLDAPGTRDIIEDGESGIILAKDTSVKDFAKACSSLMHAPDKWERLHQGAAKRAHLFDRKACAEQLQDVYRKIDQQHPSPPADEDNWTRLQERVSAEWSLLKEKAAVMAATFGSTEASETSSSVES